LASKNILESFNAKLLLLSLFVTVFLCSFFLADSYLIDLALLVSYIGLTLVLVHHRRSQMQETVEYYPANSSRSLRLSRAHERSEIKAEIEKIDSQIHSNAPETKRRSLALEKIYLENELRRLDWASKEQERLAEHDDDPTRGLDDLNSWRKERKTSEFRRHWENDSDENQPKNPWKAGKKSDDELEKRVEADAVEISTLNNLIGNIESVLEFETKETLPFALGAFVADLRAHYNAIRHLDPDSPNLKNYWAVWALTTSFLEGTPVRKDLVKYSSKNFTKRISSLAEEMRRRRSANGGIGQANHASFNASRINKNFPFNHSLQDRDETGR
jgi:hypothetical protein